jgi:hypothetical protein
MPSPGENVAILAVAGARKTETIIEAALADPDERTLITTYTTENLRQIARRIQDRVGVIPAHIRLTGWFSFLLSDAIRPYQHAVFSQIGLVRGLNFEGEHHRPPRGARLLPGLKPRRLSRRDVGPRLLHRPGIRWRGHQPAGVRL